MSNENHPTGRGPGTPGAEPAAFARGPAAERPDHRGVPGDVADLTAAERELESDLARLRPAAKAASPDELLRLAFRAGHAAADAEVAGAAAASSCSGEPPRRCWSAGWGCRCSAGPAPQVIERERTKVVYVDRLVSPPATANPAVARQSDTRSNQGNAGQSPLTAEADAGNHSTLPEFLSTLDSPSRPLIPSADADYLSVRDAVLRLGVRVIPSPRAEAPAGGPVTLETLLGPNSAAGRSREPSRRGGVGAGLDQIKKFLTGGQT